MGPGAGQAALNRPSADGRDRQVMAGFGDKRVAIHGGHGIFTTGQSVDEAAW